MLPGSPVYPAATCHLWMMTQNVGLILKPASLQRLHYIFLARPGNDGFSEEQFAPARDYFIFEKISVRFDRAPCERIDEGVDDVKVIDAIAFGVADDVAGCRFRDRKFRVDHVEGCCQHRAIERIGGRHFEMDIGAFRSGIRRRDHGKKTQCIADIIRASANEFGFDYNRSVCVGPQQVAGKAAAPTKMRADDHGSARPASASLTSRIAFSNSSCISHSALAASGSRLPFIRAGDLVEQIVKQRPKLTSKQRSILTS